jgi:arabinogalactan oligomer / maltooligosaccharide transport system substrate-binding protein
MIESFGQGRRRRSPSPARGRVGEFSDINFVVEPIPPVDGGTPQVFVGVQGFMVSSFSENPELATTFLLDFLNTEELQLELFEAGGRPPAMTSPRSSRSPTTPTSRASASPASRAHRCPPSPRWAVWGAWTDAYELVFAGADPTSTFESAAASIRSSIGG